MELKPSPKQALVVWRLLFLGEEPTMSQLRPRLSRKERGALIAAGLIETEKRGRATHLLLTDAAWVWAAAHLDAPVSRSPEAAPVLTAVLARVRGLLDTRGMTLAELVPMNEAEAAAAPTVAGGPGAAFTASTAPKAPKVPTAPGAPTASAVAGPRALSLATQVRAAYLRLSAGRLGERVRLAELRPAIGDTRARVDATLLELERQGVAVLMTLDNPMERRLDDEEAALAVAGERRHLLYMVR